jgi:hypothetical protein
MDAELSGADAAAMTKELRNWGIGLIVLGIVHIVLAQFLDAGWGMVIILIGILNLTIRHRGMFMVNGMALFLVGLMNILGSIGGGSAWAGFGVMQLVWGVQEINKFRKYAAVVQTTTVS